MVSAYPCRNKLFKARDWKWGGRGGDGGKKRERESENGRMKPTHLEERRQKESMTAWHNEIWKSVCLSIHLKKGINIKHMRAVLHSVHVYFRTNIVPDQSLPLTSLNIWQINHPPAIENGVVLFFTCRRGSEEDEDCSRDAPDLMRRSIARGAPVERRGMLFKRRCYFGFNPASWGSSCWDTAVSLDGKQKESGV